MSRPTIKQIAHVCIFAHDLAETERFWCDVLGLEIAFTFMRGDERIGYYLDLGNRTFVEVFSRADSQFEESNQINHICFETDDLDGFIAALREKNVTITDKKKGADGTWQAWTADPNGVKLEVFEYTPESQQFAGGICQVNW